MARGLFVVSAVNSTIQPGVKFVCAKGSHFEHTTWTRS